MDVPAPGVGAVCGPCPEGYTGGETKCYGELEIEHVCLRHTFTCRYK